MPVMEKKKFIRLLHKYITGYATPQERRFVENYFNLFQNDPDILKTIVPEEKEKLKAVLKSGIEDRIVRVDEKGQNNKFLHAKIIGIAAAILAMAFIASLFLLSPGASEKKTKQSEAPITQHLQNRVIFLPDGSTVMLSPGSKLNYPSSFDGAKRREVFLEGQAFFDIKHKPEKPFIVHTATLETIVLGTAFNIKAITGEMEITVTVKRGKVKVRDHDKVLGVIAPNQQIVYNTQKVSSSTKTVKTENYLSWKEQDLLLDNLTISEAAELLEERYNVKITVSDKSISTQRFTASFSTNETLEQALTSICVFNEVSYHYNKEKSWVVIGNK